MRLRLVFLKDFLCSSSVFWGSSAAGRDSGGAGGEAEELVSGDELLVLGAL